MPECAQSVGEEIANAVSHGVGLLLAAVGALILVVAAVQRTVVLEIIGASIFGATMVLVYLISTIYHGLPRNRAKRLFRTLGHCAIFFFAHAAIAPALNSIARYSLVGQKRRSLVSFELLPDIGRGVTVANSFDPFRLAIKLSVSPG